MARSRLDGFAIIVGATGGIGREVALTFAEAGAKGILLADVESQALEKAAKEVKAVAASPNCRCLSQVVNVTDVASVDAMVALAAEQFGRIDYCVNAFGVDVAEYVPLDQTDPDDYDRVMAVNAKGMFLVIRAVAKVMKAQAPGKVDLGRLGTRDVGRGAIVNVSSAMALGAVPAKTPYATSKHAITGITRSAVMDYKAQGIRINQVCPIWVRTPMFAEECRRIPQTPAILDALSPLKRPIEPDEIASACAYLCTPATVYMNGATLTIDAGLSAGPMVPW